MYRRRRRRLLGLGLRGGRGLRRLIGQGLGLRRLDHGAELERERDSTTLRPSERSAASPPFLYLASTSPKWNFSDVILSSPKINLNAQDQRGVEFKIENEIIKDGDIVLYEYCIALIL